MQILTEEQKIIKLTEIAENFGVSVEALIENKTPEEVIEQYESGTLKLLND